jgi:hypothetical protein
MSVVLTEDVFNILRQRGSSVFSSELEDWGAFKMIVNAVLQPNSDQTALATAGAVEATSGVLKAGFMFKVHTITDLAQLVARELMYNTHTN